MVERAATRGSPATNCWVAPDVINTNSAQRQRGCQRQRAAERRQSLAPGERVPMYRDERNPGITPPLDSSAGFSRRALRIRNFIGPLQGAESDLT